MLGKSRGTIDDYCVDLQGQIQGQVIENQEKPTGIALEPKVTGRIDVRQVSDVFDIRIRFQCRVANCINICI